MKASLNIFGVATLIPFAYAATYITTVFSLSSVPVSLPLPKEIRMYHRNDPLAIAAIEMHKPAMWVHSHLSGNRFTIGAYEFA